MDPAPEVLGQERPEGRARRAFIAKNEDHRGRDWTPVTAMLAMVILGVIVHGTSGAHGDRDGDEGFRAHSGGPPEVLG